MPTRKDNAHAAHELPLPKRHQAASAMKSGLGPRLQPVLMRHPPQLSVKTWGGGGGRCLGGQSGGGGFGWRVCVIKQRIQSSHMPPCHRHMVIATNFSSMFNGICTCPSPPRQALNIMEQRHSGWARVPALRVLNDNRGHTHVLNYCLLRKQGFDLLLCSTPQAWAECCLELTAVSGYRMFHGPFR